MKKKHYRWILIYIVLIFITFFAAQWWIFSDPNKQKAIVIEQKETFQTGKTNSDITKNNYDSRIGKTKNYVVGQPLKLNAPRPEDQKAVDLAETSLPDHPEFPQPDPAILSLQNSENDSLKEELAESLRRNRNLSEEEIEDHIRGVFPPLNPEKFGQIEPLDLTPEELAEEMELSLLEAGVAREDIDAMLKGFIMEIQPAEESQAPEIQLPDEKNIQRQ